MDVTSYLPPHRPPKLSMSESHFQREEAHESLFLIERCLPEIFTAILQAVVNHEASFYSPRSLAYEVRPKAPRDLALVSKRWRDIVYSTPSLWAVISIDLYPPKLQETKDRFHYLISRAKQSPVDLYIFGLHAQHNEYSSHRAKDCISTPENARYFVSRTPNIRKLHISGHEFDTSAYIPQLTPTHPEKVRELVHFISGEGVFRQLPLFNHIQQMHRLVSVWINYADRLIIPFNTGAPFFPLLKRLNLDCGYHGRPSQTVLASFLSHTPQIEELDLFLVNPHPQPYTLPNTLTLPKLHTITTHGIAALEGFINGKIKTPSLEDFRLYEWRNDANRQVSSFLRLNPSLKKVLFSVDDKADYEVALEGLNQIDELSILGGG